LDNPTGTVLRLKKSIRIKGLVSSALVGGRQARPVLRAVNVPDTWLTGSFALFDTTEKSENNGDLSLELVDVDLLFPEDLAWGEPQTWDSKKPLWSLVLPGSAIQGQTNQELHGYTGDKGDPTRSAVPLVRRVTPDGKLRCEQTTIGLHFQGSGSLTLTRVHIFNFSTAVKSEAVVAYVSLEDCIISGGHAGVLTTSHKFTATGCHFRDIGVGVGCQESDLYGWSLDHALYIEPNVDISLTNCHFYNTRKRIKTQTFDNDNTPVYSGFGDMLSPGGYGPLMSGGYKPTFPNTVVSVVGCTFKVPRAASTHPDGLTTMKDCTFYSGTNWGVNIAAQGRVVLERCHFFNDLEFNLGLEPDQVPPPGGDAVTSNNAAIFIISSSLPGSGKAQTRWATLSADSCFFHGYKAAVRMQDEGYLAGTPSSGPFKFNPVMLDFAFRKCYFGIPWLQGDAAKFGPAAAFDVSGGPSVLRIGANVYRTWVSDLRLEVPVSQRLTRAFGLTPALVASTRHAGKALAGSAAEASLAGPRVARDSPLVNREEGGVLLEMAAAMEAFEEAHEDNAAVQRLVPGPSVRHALGYRPNGKASKQDAEPADPPADPAPPAGDPKKPA
jgi:hypothetical protein